MTQPLGEKPAVMTIDKIDRAWNHTQRKAAVLTGAFSCCRFNHQVMSRDGKTTAIACDKVKLAKILETLLDVELAELRRRLVVEGGAMLPFEERVALSMNSTLQAFWNLWSFVTLRPMILADSLEEPDFVQKGWSKPFERLRQADYEAFCGGGDGKLGGYDSDPERDLDMIAWNAAMMGHLPMLRYCVEKRGANPAFQNKFGMTPLMMACRFGHEQCVRYLAPRLARADINYVSAGLGYSPLGDAAKHGHASCVAAVLEFEADVDPRRRNGKTPLHEAAQNGHAECARLLCNGGADAAAVDNDGKTPAALAAESMPVRTAVLSLLQSSTVFTKKEDVMALINARVASDDALMFT